MNAKEISDATLPAVTPDDDDLMILYDVSEGTTGKTPISGIAPKVAENIDISTLPAVTPAADDVLMIGDTSAGTTGKATIATLKNTFNEVEIVNYDVEADVQVLEGGIFKINNLVIINLNLQCNSLNDYKRLLNNLPIPKNNNAINFSFTLSGAKLSPGCGYVFNGELRTRFLGGIASGTIYISICYPV